jgi:type IV secretory pathway TrbD component
MTIDCTVRRIDPPGIVEMLAGGGLAAVVIFSVGVFLMVIPLIGWLVGPALMISAGVILLADMRGIFRRKTGYAGHCPSCGEPAMAGDPESVGECGACHSPFVHHDGQLVKVA